MSKRSGRSQVAGLPEWDRCAVMGVVNLTPDSFSDGGHWFDTTTAVKHGLDLVAEGADLVDVGGESTRPGAARVDEAEELKPRHPGRPGPRPGGRHRLGRHDARLPWPISSLAAGAVLVNDVSGGLADPGDDPGRRRRRRPLRRHALARLPAGRQRQGRRTRTSSPKSSTSSTRAWRPFWRAASPRTASSSTRASASPRTPSTTSILLAHLDRLRDLGPPLAGGRLPQAVPGPRTGGPGGRPAARPRARRRHRRRLRARRPRRARGPSASTRYAPPPTPSGSPGPWRAPGPQRESPVSAPHTDVEQVELANTAFYEATGAGRLRRAVRRSG